MAEGVDYRLRNKYFAAYGAVLAFRKTGCRTGGCHCLIDYFGVALGLNFRLRHNHLAACATMLAFRKSRFGTSRSNCRIDYFGVSGGSYFIRHIAVPAVRARIGSITLLRTGGSGYCSRIAVSELRNRSLGDQNRVTYGTVLAFRKTGCRTGCIHCRVDHFGMAESVNRFLGHQNFAAFGAVLAFRKTGFRTGRIHCCIDHFGMTEGVNRFLGHQNFFTYGAVLAFRKTGCRTGGCHCLIGYFGVALGLNFRLFYQYFAAYGALQSRGKTGFRAGCFHCRDNLPGVSLGNHCKSCFGGCGRSCFIQEESTAILTAALVMFLVSVFGTGGFLSLHLFGQMIEEVNIFRVGMSRIILTGKGLYAPFCTGRLCGNFTVVIGMTGSSDRLCRNGGFHRTVFILEYAGTAAAGVVCMVAGCRTGGCLGFGQDRAVTKGSNLTVRGVIAVFAVLVCIPAAFRTGCCLGSYGCGVVTGGRDDRLLNGGFTYTVFILKYLVTSFAGVVFNVAGFCTGGCLGIGLGHFVTEGRENLLLNSGFHDTVFILEYAAASCAGIVFIVAGCCTGGCLGIGLDHAVTEGIGSLLCFQDFTAYGAFHSRGKTGFGTGCRHCGDSLLGMTLGGNNLRHSLLFRPCDNKGCGVRSETIFRTGSRFRLIDSYRCLYCIHVAAVIGTYTLSGAVDVAV